MNNQPGVFPLLTLLLCISLTGCIVVPKKVASYDSECKTNTNKIELDVALIKSGDYWTYPESYEWDIPEKITGALITTAATTLVSGSIAVAGNAFYQLENALDCQAQYPSPSQPTNSQPKQIDDSNNEYVIEEEIISARS